MKERVESEAKIIIEKAELEAKSLKQQVFQRENLVKNEIDNLRRYKYNFKEKFKSMLNLYLKMIENEDFGEKGNYKIEEEVSKEKAEKRVSEEKVDKLEGLGIEDNFKIKETEDEQ
jgi:cell division initiation protein